MGRRAKNECRTCADSVGSLATGENLDAALELDRPPCWNQSGKLTPGTIAWAGGGLFLHESLPTLSMVEKSVVTVGLFIIFTTDELPKLDPILKASMTAASNWRCVTFPSRTEFTYFTVCAKSWESSVSAST
jgi:hypothetical protein